jgi:glycosyltransferase involved in cell wall biosynthesis
VRNIVMQADALWFGTPEERELLYRAQPVARHRTHAVGTVGVDATASGDAQRFCGRFGLAGPFLLYGGRLTPGKGVDDLLVAFREIRRQAPAARLVITGSAASVLQDGVVVTGQLDEQSWRDALAAATVVVVPSTMESLSLLALEAWAAGKPCIVNAESAVLTGQARRSGGALTYKGISGLVTSALTLLGDGAHAARLGAAGRSYVVQRYSWDMVVEQLQSLIEAASERS